MWLWLGLAGMLALGIGGLLDPAGALRGLLFAFLLCIAVPMGSGVLLLVHALTGGTWGEVLRPLLRRCAVLMPLFLLAFGPIAFGARLIYPWAAEASAARWPDVAAIYLDVPGFALRGIVILALWSLIAIAAWRGRLAPLWAGLALAAYGVTVSIAAVDWSMSLAPHWTSTSYGALMAIGQIGEALAVAAIVRAGSRADAASADLAGLLLACLLGYVYLGFMQYLVIWSGNLPEKVAWYLPRLRHAWLAMLWGALLIGVFAPFLLLLSRRARRSNRATGVAGALVLAGFLLDRLWQTAANFPGAAVWGYVVAPLALAGVLIGLAQRLGEPYRDEVAHRA
jgi:hypothetical protein